MLPINKLDIAIFIFILYNIIIVCAKPNIQIEEANICKWIVVILAYVLTRYVKDRKLIFYALVLSGTGEAMTAIGQKFLWLESQHPRFDVTGNLGNPGPLGGYLAVCIIINFYLLWENYKLKTKCLFIGLSITCILIATGEVISDSRAALVSILVGGLALLPMRQWVNTLKQKIIIICVSSITCIIIGLLLYQYRPHSADGRLLIWKVSAEMIADKPLFGHGIGSFNNQYMLYQAQYFNAANRISESMVADNVAYPYNELLGITIETGIIGLLLACLISIIAMMSKSSCTFQRATKSALLTWATFSMFSYPTEILPLFILLPILLACVELSSCISYTVNKKMALSISIICIVICIYTFNVGCFYKTLSKEIALLVDNEQNNTIEFLAMHYPKMKQNVKFNTIYNRWVMKHSADSQKLVQVKDIIPSSENYCLLGDYYFKLGMFETAEQTYQMAANMIPSRLMPNYKLWRLYLRTKNHAKAIGTAKQMLSQPLKIENSFTINAKSEVRSFLELHL